VVTARDTKQIEDIVAAHPGACLSLALDVTDTARLAEAVSQTEKRFGRIDVLVNNAGYGYLAAVEEGEDREVRAMFETNFFALLALTRRVLPGMRVR
jgi:NADP-dependent 3-hydroxy acid dehydrogenase YdfG